MPRKASYRRTSTDLIVSEMKRFQKGIKFDDEIVSVDKWVDIGIENPKIKLFSPKESTNLTRAFILALGPWVISGMRYGAGEKFRVKQACAGIDNLTSDSEKTPKELSEFF
ncbi:MAG: hypothetical protein ABH878_08790 [bacterium]